MQKIQKKKTSILYDIEFKILNGEEPSIIVYTIIFFINGFCESVSFYEFNELGEQKIFELPEITIFYLEIGFIGFFIILTLVAYFKLAFKSIWIYFLLLLQALTPVYIRSSCLCFIQGGWCQSDLKYQVGSSMILTVLIVILFSLKNMLYYPFYDNKNLLSMHQRNISIYLFCYRLLFGVFNYLPLFTYFTLKTKALFILCFIVFAGSRKSGYQNPFAKKIWNLFFVYLLWASAVGFFVEAFSELGMVEEGWKHENGFWYLWGYPLPFIILGSLSIEISTDKKMWKKILLASDHIIDSKENLYLICSQFQSQIKKIRKSELKSKDPDFKQLWELVQWHNLECCNPLCPINELKVLSTKRSDDFLQQKRLTKTIQNSFQYGKFILQRMRLQNPNDINLMIEIAFYELETLQNKQKGLLLYNQYYQKDDLSVHHKYAIFFLKQKIDFMHTGNGKFSKANADSQISQFRHKIEVSVTMLAQFWYFLADPKCNLKKLYDLANVLFPLKIGVETDWQHIRKLKNIQSYNFYAKYLIKMFNDKEKGMKILEEAKRIEEELRQRQQIELNPDGPDQAIAEETGIIFLEFDGKNSGIMYQVSLNVQKIFGYNKGQLSNQKVNGIMPMLFSNYHDRILDNYQQTNKSKMMNKERQVWGKSKNGYIFPFVILIKPVCNFYSQTSEVYASVRRQLWLKEIAGIIIEKDKVISEVSASALPIFPELIGKVPGKKKIMIEDILPNFEKMREKILQENQTYEHVIEREFKIDANHRALQEAVYSVHMEEISITIAGHIGFLIKFSKISTRVLKAEKPVLQISPLTEGHFAFTYNLPNSGEEKKGSISEPPHSQCSNFNVSSNVFDKINEVSLHFIGGFFEGCKLIDNLMQSSAVFFQQKIKMSKSQSHIIIKNYGQEIKTKRLFSKQIRQIHEEEEDTSFKGMEEEKEKSTGHAIGLVKPSDLGLILEREASNRTVSYLKFLTGFILFVSSIAYILQYLLAIDIETAILSNISNLKNINELQAQVLYLKSHVTRFSLHEMTSSEKQKFVDDINQLDNYLDDYEFNVNTRIVYQDQSSDSYYLGFGLNKLVSESNSLKQITGILGNSSNIFFVKFNTVNGLFESIEKEKVLLFDQCLSNFQDLIKLHFIILSVMGSILIILLFIKNFMVRTVLEKKAKILEVFFEIPRKSCSLIQKQCQRFILKLSSEEDNVDLNSDISDEEGQQFTEKKKHTQKKRTVIGEQKTTSSFIITTILFFILLLSFHVFSLLKDAIRREKLEYSSEAIYQFFQLEPEILKLTAFMNSFVEDPEIPILSNYDHMEVIESQNSNILSKYSDMRILHYNIVDILDERFLSESNVILYTDLCKQSANLCDEDYGGKEGISSVLVKYLNFLSERFSDLSNYTNTINSTEKAEFLAKNFLDKERSFQLIVKQWWREVTIILKSGLSRYLSQTKQLSFGMMIALCVFNFSVLMLAWMKFYQSLEHKITATEYILTFIPIDEINKNPKISQYIKEQILDKR